MTTLRGLDCLCQVVHDWFRLGLANPNKQYKNTKSVHKVTPINTTIAKYYVHTISGLYLYALGGSSTPVQQQDTAISLPPSQLG